jgi:imidazolonepropionase-like amidohydrolase
MKGQLLAVSAAMLCAMSGAEGQYPSASSAGTVAFVNVHVVDADRQRVVRNQTVLLERGVVIAAGDHGTVLVPAGAAVVQGGGERFLLPGLVDFHVHSVDAIEWPAYLRAGITTVVQMGHATPADIASFRAQEQRGADVPRVVFGRMMTQPWAGRPGIGTEAEGAVAVRAARRDGYAFIKAYSYLAPQVYHAITREARLAGIPVFGHSVETIGLEQTLDSGMVVLAHIEELLGSLGPALHPSRMHVVADGLRARGTRVVTTLVALEEVARQWGRRDVIDQYLREADTSALGPRWRQTWQRGELARQPANRADTAALWYERAKEFAAVLHAAGVPLLVGTDATMVGVFPGRSIRREMHNLAAAGLQPAAILASATSVPLRVLRELLPETASDSRIAVGNMVDLILSRRDPLTDATAATEPEGVLLRGKWIAFSPTQGVQR